MSGGPSRCVLRSGPAHTADRGKRCARFKRGDDRLSHVGVNVPGNRGEPRLDGIEAFGDGDEAATLDHTFNRALAVVCGGGIAVHYRYRGGDVAERHFVATERLQRRVGVDRFVGRIRIDERCFLLKNGFAQQCDHTLALGKPLAAYARQLARRLGLPHEEEPRHPAIGEAEAIQIVEEARPARSRKAAHRHDPHMASPSIGFNPPASGSLARSASRCIGVSGTPTGCGCEDTVPCR